MPTENRNGRVITFYSYKGGTGRTMALANTAWILAAGGRKVLTVDWDLEAPGLHRFFHPFIGSAVLSSTTGMIDLITAYREEALRNVPRAEDWHREYARVRPHAVSLSWHFPEGGCLDFLSAGRQNRDYSASMGSIDWDVFYDRYGGGQFFDALREDMRTHYDYTLIDSRTGLSDTADICTVQMPDCLVVCFTLSDQSIEGAAAVAKDIEERYAGRSIRVLPVPMRIDEGEKDKADVGRALARSRFGGLPSGLSESQLTAYWGSVEIPYRPFYAYEEILAAFGDPPGLSTSMLSACERLTSELSEGRVVALPPMSEAERLRHMDSFTRRRPGVPADLMLVHVPEDRMWADWLEVVLTRAGFRVTPRDLDADPAVGAEFDKAGGDAAHRTLVVLSAACARSPKARRLWEDAVNRDPGSVRERLIAVRVDDIRMDVLPLRGAVAVAHLDEASATRAVLRALDREVPESLGAEETPIGPRFPNRKLKVENLRPRNNWFTGRTRVLDEIRAGLAGAAPSERPGPLTVHGLGGVGKTQVALEYAHRFKADYDLIWWIEAEREDRVMVSLSELAEALKTGSGEGVADAANAAVEELRRGGRYPRWLLVFDNAERPDLIRQYFPGGEGHVLVTSRDKQPVTPGGSLEVDVFTRAESVEHLRRRVDGLQGAEADQVAEAVGDLPLAVEVAAAWLNETATPVENYVTLLKEQATAALSMTVLQDYSRPVEAAWNLSIARLREESAAAGRLLELCSVFASEPISMALLQSDAAIEALLPYDAQLRDRYMIGKVVQSLNRFALAKVDPADSSIQVHRLVQAAVRDGMDQERQEETMHEVHRILAGARPSTPSDGPVDDPANWPVFETIWPHLTPSNTELCDEELPRQMLVDRMRYLWKRGELASARALGERLDELWTGKRGDRDPQTLNLRFELANVLRSQGEHRMAMDLNESTLRLQSEVLPPGHTNTLITAGSLAADLRVHGRFREALERDKEIFRGLRTTFGEQQGRVLIAANNLAIDHRLLGDCREARRLDEATLEMRTLVLGRQHPYTLLSKAHVARDMREAGEYAESVSWLQEVMTEYQEVLRMDIPETLRTAKSLAVSLRKTGRTAEALRITQDTYRSYLDRYGSEVPDALACALNLAADTAATTDDHEAATRRAARAVSGYRRVLGARHPFTLAAAGNMTIHLRASGSLQEAARLGEDTLEALREVVGADHPYALCCQVNLGNTYGDLGERGSPADQERSEEMLRDAVHGLNALYWPEHPDVLSAEICLAVTIRQDEARARPLRDRVLDEVARRYGPGHPLATAARSWHRVGCDVEPQPF